MDATAAKVRLDSDGYIGEDVYCTECSYNLRGIHPDGACPECGTLTAKAFDTLQFSDPAWIFGLSSGLNWILFGLYFSIVFTILAALLQGIFIIQGSAQSRFATSLLLLLPVLAYVWGVWKFTTPENPEINRKPSVARPLTRYTILISAVLVWIPEFLPGPHPIAPSRSPTPTKVPLGEYQNFFADLSSGPSFPPLDGLMLVSALAMLASFVLLMVGTFAGLVYARQIALRIPDKKLGRNTSIVMWGLIAIGLMLVLMVLLGIASVLMSESQAGVVTAIAMIIPGCASIIGVLVFCGWAFVLLSQFRKKLKMVAQRAALRKVEPSAN